VDEPRSTLHQAAQAFEREADLMEAVVRAKRRHVYLGELVLARSAADVMLALEMGAPLGNDGDDLDEHTQAVYDAVFASAYEHFAAELAAERLPELLGVDGGQRIAGQVGDRQGDGEAPSAPTSPN
jgi:hypothetical protein